MSDYQSVRQALESGADPRMLCATCPWDRLCVNPPSMTSDQVRQQIEQAKAKDEAQDPEKKQMPFGMLLTAVTLGGRDTQGEMCPVFAMQLRTSDGRAIADGIRAIMQGVTP